MTSEEAGRLSRMFQNATLCTSLESVSTRHQRSLRHTEAPCDPCANSFGGFLDTHGTLDLRRCMSESDDTPSTATTCPPGRKTYTSTWRSQTIPDAAAAR